MEDLKKIIAVFIKKDPETISDSTLINSKAIPGSIFLHRMYSVINKAGYNVNNYSNINTFGELVSLLNGKSAGNASITSEKISTNYEALENENPAIGVDLEAIDNLPVANDFREHEFYINNFSAEEISYSLLKTQPYETFAGLFSAKEALCKVNNNLRSRPFNQIVIKHTPDGKPIFENYSISISHTKTHSIAVAFLNNNSMSFIKERNDDGEGHSLVNEPLKYINNATAIRGSSEQT